MSLIKVEMKRLGQYRHQEFPVALIEVTCCAECPYLVDEGKFFRCPFNDRVIPIEQAKAPGLPSDCYFIRFSDFYATGNLTATAEGNK